MCGNASASLNTHPFIQTVIKLRVSEHLMVFRSKCLLRFDRLFTIGEKCIERQNKFFGFQRTFLLNILRLSDNFGVRFLEFKFEFISTKDTNWFKMSLYALNIKD